MGIRGAALVAVLAVAGCGGGEKESPAPENDVPNTISFSTPAFKDGGAIPAANTCDGAGKAPTLAWRAAPAEAAELVLVVEDPDAGDTPFTHWTSYGIVAATGSGLAPDGQFPAGVKQGRNSAGKDGWTPPCPPKGEDAHHYVFTFYALPKGTTLAPGAQPDAVRAAVKDAVARGTFTGTYKR